MAGSDDSELARRVAQGEAAGFEELMRREGPRLMALARRMMATEEDAREVFQEAMLTVSRRIGGFEGRSSLGTWMYRITANACLMRLRKAASKAEGFIDDLMPQFDDRSCRLGEGSGPVPTPESLLAKEQTRAAVRRAIDELPGPYRAVLVLRDIEERPAAEVAELMGITANAVNVRLHRARAALKKLLDPMLASSTTTERATLARESAT